MGTFDKNTYEIVKRLQNARLSLLSKQPFFALLLMHMKFALDITCETAYTDGYRIAFNPDFINGLSNKELEFVLMHEVLHAVLGHTFRAQSDYDLECYDIACDIVVNSNILYCFDMDIKSITLKKYGVAMHKTPSGEEGYKFSVEQIYDQLTAAKDKPKSKKPNKSQSNQKSTDKDNYCNNKTNEKDNSIKNGNSESEDNGNGEGKETGSQKNNSKGEKTSKSKSGGSKVPGVTQKDLDELISSLLKRRDVNGEIDPNTEIKDNTDALNLPQKTVDDHSFWTGDEEDNIGRDTWLNRMIEATDIIASTQGDKLRGTIPLAAQRLVEELKNPVLDWRTILNDFVQEEICDYSFLPPDKRMEDSMFFLPDFSEKDETAKDILFMIDTSASMSDTQISQCYSEIYGAIQQFGGKLQGKLGFFDAVVVEPISFEDEDEFKIIRPIGGGGTSFQVIFDYVQEKMKDDPPVSIVILTDGFAPFPDEKDANDIPVLWIINNDNVNPPWGKVARVLDEKL